MNSVPISPGVDLSRPRLKQLASWIRDDLDIIVAREGPEKLRADDILLLHEVFQALRVSSTITSLDLRATGIHRAVMEVAGIATRWPGRLADDCDKIISAWTERFGSLKDLHPFMYGRGGRLEGIASAEEFSKAVCFAHRFLLYGMTSDITPSGTSPEMGEGLSRQDCSTTFTKTR